MLRTAEIYSLSKVKYVGDKTLNAIIDLTHKIGVSRLEELTPALLASKVRLNKAAKEHLEQFWQDLAKKISDAEAQLAQWQSNGITVLNCKDPRYPHYLTLCEDAPPLLYCKGNLECLSNAQSVAVIGTRENTEMGRSIAGRTVGYLVENGQTIVSGLAKGIDSIAHEACLQHGGKTIAVLVDVEKIYPSINKSLAARILSQGGLLIAENPPGTAMLPQLLVKRDRIQAGLSTAVFPIETSRNGGTMHAVRAAAKYGRYVFAPDINSGMYPDLSITQLEGIIALIQNGDAQPYSKSRYPEIIQQLLRKEQELAKQQQAAGRRELEAQGLLV